MDTLTSPVPLETLPAIRCDNSGPVFHEPWEAEAFSLAVHMSKTGQFTWSEWVDVFSQEIKAAQQAGDPDLGDTYYHHWLNALERISIQKGLVSQDEMLQRKADWRQAYLNTPHGMPIELAAAYRPRAHEHDHDDADDHDHDDDRDDDHDHDHEHYAHLN